MGLGDRRGDRKGGWEGQEGAGWGKIGPNKLFLWPKTGEKIGHHPGDPIHSATLLFRRQRHCQETLECEPSCKPRQDCSAPEHAQKMHGRALEYMKTKLSQVINSKFLGQISCRFHFPRRQRMKRLILEVNLCFFMNRTNLKFPDVSLTPFDAEL